MNRRGLIVRESGDEASETHLPDACRSPDANGQDVEMIWESDYGYRSGSRSPTTASPSPKTGTRSLEIRMPGARAPETRNPILRQDAFFPHQRAIRV